MEAPKRLRDLLWIPALVRTGPGFKGTELGEVLIPALSPFSFRHADEAVRLGRATVWEEPEGGEPIPFGSKTLLVDGEDVPLLEVRKLEIAAAETDANASA
jgi:type VI secretion system protein ImpE